MVAQWVDPTLSDTCSRERSLPDRPVYRDEGGRADVIAVSDRLRHWLSWIRIHLGVVVPDKVKEWKRNLLRDSTVTKGRF